MSDSTRLRILNTIEQMCKLCVEQMYRLPSSLPSLTINGQKYQWNNNIDDRDRRDFTRYIYVLSTIHRLVRTQSRMNMRELFYSQVNLFHHQRVSDNIVEQITKHLCVDRRQLGLVATAKGFCSGNVQYRNLRSGEIINCNQLSNGQLIIDDDIEIIETENRITFILVVEKDTIFQHLLNDGFLTRYCGACLITGRGQPDHATRSFLLQLSRLYMDTPIYILTDCDIFGVLIACTYQSTFDGNHHNRIRWLGVWPEELLSLFSKSISQTLPITDERERRMITRFIQRSDINDEWRRQVSFFEQHQRKMEIEAIYESGTKKLIDDYLHDKLMGHRWL
ncbi:unnamed protein product [Rotaria sp. Silwood2]|nr:unnamed protein product [Rotaria sp. Silwood2]CAF2634057.1 unnamed protein product [Rotaria sp. Silwood2]CAF2883616.1 unnamed protein product [Rotaria sp. Silwood2]CAF3035409.1 unnamed protein product [Rotaria sp. Silwood2]CAF4210940.1 unnamed protein product [Rotaria sp. Silwood2]